MEKIQINNELRDRAFNCAKAHGFHDKEYSDEHWLMLIVSEIGEAVNADRNGKRANKEHVEYELTNLESKGYFARGFDYLIKGSIEEELADVVIRCLDFAGLKNINIDISSTLPIFTDIDLPLIDNLFAISAIIYHPKMIITLQHKVNRIIVTTLCLARQLHIDIGWHIEQKMKYNELRPMLNSKKY